MPAKQTKKHYENNPFFIASTGITLLFNLARNVAILFVVLSVFGLLANSLPDPGQPQSSDVLSVFQDWTVDQWILFIAAISVIGLAFVMITSLFNGVSAYTSAQLSKGEEVGLRDAFRESFDKLWSFIWLQILIFVKIVLWSLLFIIPGIIMAVRYTLANVAFFDDTKNLRGNDAIKESLRLTRGAWITTYASSVLFNMLTLGAISNVIETGVNAVLYKQFQQAGDKKPAAHWLSWLALVLPFAILSLVIFAIIVIAIVVGVMGHKTV